MLFSSVLHLLFRDSTYQPGFASRTREFSQLQQNWQDLKGKGWMNWSMKFQCTAEMNAQWRANGKCEGEIRALTDVNRPLLIQNGFNSYLGLNHTHQLASFPNYA